MPVKTVKQGNKFVVRDDKGKTFGTHATKEKAQAQASAINIRTSKGKK